MKYFIGLQLPENLETNILSSRELHKTYTTIPHINLISSKYMPDNDMFIEQLIKICNSIKPFYVTTGKICCHNNKIVYQHILCDELESIRNEIAEGLGIELSTNNYVPNFVIEKSYFINKYKYKTILEEAKDYFPEHYKFMIESITVYQQKNIDVPYKPYIQINL